MTLDKVSLGPEECRWPWTNSLGSMCVKGFGFKKPCKI